MVTDQYIPKSDIKSNKKFSIIVCTHNARPDLVHCLESLERQTYPNFEVVVVDDASSDNTLKYLEEYSRQSKLQLKIVVNENNLGVAGSRNVGIKSANGDIVGFTDSDCIANEDWISELAKGFMQNDVVAVGGYIQDDQVNNIWELTNKGYNFVAAEEGFVTYIQGCNMSFDRRVLEKFMFNDEIKYGYEETLICDKLIQNGYKIYYQPGAMVLHKHRHTLSGLIRQKYLRGFSSIWYRKKQKMFPLLKRHFLLLIVLFLIPLAMVSYIFSVVIALIMMLVVSSLFRDEVIYGSKTSKEIFLTFPLVLFVEMAHFFGAFIGLYKFYLSFPAKNKALKF